MSAASSPSPAVSRSPAVKARRLRMRLPWWAPALAAASFAALLALVASASEASAASPPQGLTWLLEALARILPIGV
ncbi:hypothetical protein [Streptomyces sp. NPDC059008]|uniref:hypothetical protein n=1 Tax=Streptomyces sp. NPDC059008 TaxID=3346693 RepID=UPI0036B5A325